MTAILACSNLKNLEKKHSSPTIMTSPNSTPVLDSISVPQGAAAGGIAPSVAPSRSIQRDVSANSSSGIGTFGVRDDLCMFLCDTDRLALTGKVWACADVKSEYCHIFHCVRVLIYGEINWVEL